MSPQAADDHTPDADDDFVYSNRGVESEEQQQTTHDQELEQAVEWLLRFNSSHDHTEVEKENGSKPSFWNDRNLAVSDAVNPPILVNDDDDEQREGKPAIDSERDDSFLNGEEFLFDEGRSHDDQDYDGASPPAVVVHQAEAVQSDGAEQWLTRGLESWRRQKQQERQRNSSSSSRHNHEIDFLQLQPSGSTLTQDRYLALEARSSTSSPGKKSSSLRDRLDYKVAIAMKRRADQQRIIEAVNDTLNRTQEDLLDTTTSLFGDEEQDDHHLPTSPMSDSGVGTQYFNSRQASTRRKMQAAISDDVANVSSYRLSRTVRYGRRGEMPTGHSNIIKLHVYDLLHNNTVMTLPFGCAFPIGQCFETLNNGLYALGTGAYHCGIEVNGIEYGYGANDVVGNTGVFTCIPKHSPGYGYRSTIDFGSRVAQHTSWVEVETNLVNTKTGQGRPVSNHYEKMKNSLDGATILRQMALEYRGTEYDLLRRNCCTFAKEACLRLGVHEEEIPSWFLNLANAGGNARDAATCFAYRGDGGGAIQQQPRVTMQAYSRSPPRSRRRRWSSFDQEEEECALGFEAILEDKKTNVLLVDASTLKDPEGAAVIGVRRTTSWTY